MPQCGRFLMVLVSLHACGRFLMVLVSLCACGRFLAVLVLLIVISTYSTSDNVTLLVSAGLCK